VTEAHRCEKLAQGFYAAYPAETLTHDLLIASLTLYHSATMPPGYQLPLEKEHEVLATTNLLPGFLMHWYGWYVLADNKADYPHPADWITY